MAAEASGARYRSSQSYSWVNVLSDAFVLTLKSLIAINTFVETLGKYWERFLSVTHDFSDILWWFTNYFLYQSQLWCRAAVIATNLSWCISWI